MPWAELPATTSTLTELYHCITDVATTAEGYQPRNYAMGYDASKKLALWVAYPLHTYYTTGTSRERQWGYDPKLAKTDQMTEGLVSTEYNRGHQVPNADRRISNNANDQISYYSNMPAQLSNFNGGVWSVLEGKVRNWMCADTLYVVSGCYFDGTQTTTQDKGGYDLPVPTHYYKVVLRSKSGSTGKAIGTLAAEDLQCIGFWYSHAASSGQTPATCVKSVADIEKICGFEFFVNVPNAPKGSYSRTDWGL